MVSKEEQREGYLTAIEVAKLLAENKEFNAEGRDHKFYRDKINQLQTLFKKQLLIRYYNGGVAFGEKNGDNIFAPAVLSLPNDITVSIAWWHPGIGRPHVPVFHKDSLSEVGRLIKFAQEYLAAQNEGKPRVAQLTMPQLAEKIGNEMLESGNRDPQNNTPTPRVSAVQKEPSRSARPKLPEPRFVPILTALGTYNSTHQDNKVRRLSAVRQRIEDLISVTVKNGRREEIHPNQPVTVQVADTEFQIQKQMRQGAPCWHIREEDIDKALPVLLNKLEEARRHKQKSGSSSWRTYGGGEQQGSSFER